MVSKTNRMFCYFICFIIWCTFITSIVKAEAAVTIIDEWTQTFLDEIPCSDIGQSYSANNATIDSVGLTRSNSFVNDPDNSSNVFLQMNITQSSESDFYNSIRMSSAYAIDPSNSIYIETRVKLSNPNLPLKFQIKGYDSSNNMIELINVGLMDDQIINLDKSPGKWHEFGVRINRTGSGGTYRLYWDGVVIGRKSMPMQNFNDTICGVVPILICEGGNIENAAYPEYVQIDYIGALKIKNDVDVIKVIPENDSNDVRVSTNKVEIVFNNLINRNSIIMSSNPESNSVEFLNADTETEFVGLGLIIIKFNRIIIPFNTPLDYETKYKIKIKNIKFQLAKDNEEIIDVPLPQELISFMFKTGGKLTIDVLRFRDNNLNDITEHGLKPGEIFAEIAFNNADSVEIQGVCILALYGVLDKADSLVCYNLNPVNIEALSLTQITTEAIQVPDDGKKYKLIIYLWDSIESGMAYIRPETFDKSGVWENFNERLSLIGQSPIDYSIGTVSFLDNMQDVEKGQWLTLIAKNEDNNIINAIVQTKAGENGDFIFTYALSKLVTNGSNQLFIKGPPGSQLLPIRTIVVDVSKILPIASKLSINNDAGSIAGKKLTIRYKYTHLLGLHEGNSIFRWLRDDGNNNYTVLQNSEKAEYTPTTNDEMKSIIVEAIIKVAGSSASNVFTSSSVFIMPTPRAEHVIITKNPGGVITTAKAGETLIGDYQYIYNSTINTQDVSEYRWISSDNENFEDGIEVGSNIAYTTSKNDYGKYLRFEVQPKRNQKEVDVTPVEGISVLSSNIVYIKEAEDKPVRGSSGGRSTSIKVPKSTIVPIMTPAPVPQLVERFNDIESHWAKADIEFMFSNGFVKGVAPGVFSPDEQVKRSEFAALLVRVLDLEISKYDQSYNDVQIDIWYANIVQATSESGLMSGYNGSFRPDDNITREEMCKVIIEAYKKVEGAVFIKRSKNDFEDQELMSEWAIPYIESAYELGFVAGTGENKFEPKGNTTRAQSITILKRLYEKLN